MDEYGLTDKDEVRKWYDGFIFGKNRAMYNPWSIINYLAERTLAPYWAQTSSNALVGQLLAANDIKEEISALLRGESITTVLDEQIVFSELYERPGAIWSFLLATGYVKPLSCDLSCHTYTLSLTNYEIHLIFENLISAWFTKANNYGRQFREALLTNDVYYMNVFLKKIVDDTFSFFDTGGHEPEKFYHGFVLGLIVDLKDNYKIRSNRESGLGRYDVIMLPKKPGYHGIVIEFKTFQPDKENNLQETCQQALRQIYEKYYINELLERDININDIFTYGFAFQGKEFYINGGQYNSLDFKIYK